MRHWLCEIYLLEILIKTIVIVIFWECNLDSAAVNQKYPYLIFLFDMNRRKLAVRLFHKPLCEIDFRDNVSYKFTKIRRDNGELPVYSLSNL